MIFTLGCPTQEALPLWHPHCGRTAFCRVTQPQWLLVLLISNLINTPLCVGLGSARYEDIAEPNNYLTVVYVPT